MRRQNPLEIQELLGICISIIADSTTNLLACSLVAHLWVNSAQSHHLLKRYSRRQNSPTAIATNSFSWIQPTRRAIPQCTRRFPHLSPATSPLGNPKCSRNCSALSTCPLANSSSSSRHNRTPEIRTSNDPAAQSQAFQRLLRIYG
ncbi:hypothetical protein R3P38DRAFT_600409 [Favolaschia claudopus]|uniref:Uncharacterized protein n=1 Tax=Favolaschia claudopus TaxID=2862362 RepID=A0AAV9Z8H2_9AGAR